ncbi:MAG: cytochrome c4 [Xanthomonadales bacterium]|nr:cytochrome c4 [Xanthomonadales bacterium]MDL1869637.1 c-type cytochrome [Gammaproteobacteria bacterium PRO6]
MTSKTMPCLALLAALPLLLPATVNAQAQSAAKPVAPAKWLDKRGHAPIHGDAAAGKAKSEVCRACHGQDGNTPVPTFPNLGGQRADFLYWELVELKHGYRYQSPMTEQLTPLSDQDVRDLAVFFASQPLAHASDAAADPAAIALGGQIFRGGDPQRGVPPCQGCHGADGEGIAQRPGWPVLQGQHPAYLAARLRAYRDGDPPNSSNDFIMNGVARGLDDAAIDGLAAWLVSRPGTPER